MLSGENVQLMKKNFGNHYINNENDTKKFNAKMNVTKRIILHGLFGFLLLFTFLLTTNNNNFEFELYDRKITRC